MLQAFEAAEAGARLPPLQTRFPARFTHTPIETCDLRDMAGLVALLSAWLGEIGAGFDFSRGPAIP